MLDVKIIAHRGASGDAPENTLVAFRLAWERGADGIEGDFRLTNDGHIVCIHDESTKRTAGRNLVVAKASLADLQTLDVGGWRGERWKGERIPTLEDVIATIPAGKTFFIEVKSGTDIVPKLKTALAASSLATGQVAVIAFDKDVVQAVKQELPETKVLWLLARSRENGRQRPSAEEVVATLRELGADGVDCKAEGIDAAFVSAVTTAGVEVHVWTVDDAGLARRIAGYGVSSITTNRPDSVGRDRIQETGV